MIKLSYAVINKDDFVNALKGLAYQRMSSKTAYKINKIMDAVESEIKKARPVFMELVKKYAVTGEDGKLVPTEEGHVKLDDSKKEEYEKHFEEFLTTEFTIEQHKISLMELQHAQLAPAEMAALEPVLTEANLEVVGGNVAPISS